MSSLDSAPKPHQPQPSKVRVMALRYQKYLAKKQDQAKLHPRLACVRN